MSAYQRKLELLDFIEQFHGDTGAVTRAVDELRSLIEADEATEQQDTPEVPVEHEHGYTYLVNMQAATEMTIDWRYSDAETQEKFLKFLWENVIDWFRSSSLST